MALVLGMPSTEATAHFFSHGIYMSLKVKGREWVGHFVPTAVQTLPSHEKANTTIIA